jgi:ABC-2 type transport system ATP-binding protein
MENVIEIENLTMDYVVGFWRSRRVRSLDGLSLAVTRGEVFGFLGHNGAGKTTTLKILMRIIYPTGGAARILGKPLDDIEMRRRIGYLPETPYFYDYLTGRELLDYFAKLGGLDAQTRQRRIDETLRLVGMTDAAGRQLRKYSKGMLQRIGIAQAVVNDPEIVFLDEPMSGLDPIGRREVRDIIAGLRDQGKTVFFSTHILSDVEALCDRIAILKNGRRVAYGPLAEIQGSQASTLEVVVASVTDRAFDALTACADRVRRTASGVHCEIADESKLEETVRLLRAHGGRLISVNPLRNALEEYFVRDESVKFVK